MHLHDSAGLYGAEAVILSLSKALEMTQYHAVIGCLIGMDHEKSEFGKAAEENKFDVEYLRMRNKIDLSVVLRLGKLIRERDIKLIHAHGYKSNLIGLLASKLLHVPTITTNHLFPLMPLEDRKLQFYSRIDVSFTMKRLWKIVAVSEEIRDKLIAKGVEDLKIAIIDNGIDIEKYAAPNEVDKSALRESLQIRKDSFVVGTFGRLTYQKGQIYLLEAAKTVLADNIPVVFLIAGDGPLRVQLERQADDLNIAQNVKFLGFRKDTADLLGIMDLFVMSSLDEGLPMAMIEAMASCTPVVVTSVGGIPKVVKDSENGILVAARDSTMLARKMASLLRNKQLRDELANNAFQTVKEFHSKETMCSKYLEIYDDIIAQQQYS